MMGIMKNVKQDVVLVATCYKTDRKRLLNQQVIRSTWQRLKKLNGDGNHENIKQDVVQVVPC